MSSRAEDTPSIRRGRSKRARGAAGKSFSKPVSGETQQSGSTGESAAFASEVLELLLDILVRTGHSPNELAVEFDRISTRFKEPTHRWDPSKLGFLADLPHVIALWHSDPQYHDRDGNLRPLRLGGAAPSLGTLFTRVLPVEDPRQVLRALLRMKGVRRQGVGYVPTARHLSYREDIGRVYSLGMLRRALRTVQRNISGQQKGIFERSAINPDFPVRVLGTYHRRLEPLADGFLQTCDTDLNRYAVENPGGERTRVGIEVFVFEEPLPPPPSRPYGSRS